MPVYTIVAKQRGAHVNLRSVLHGGIMLLPAFEIPACTLTTAISHHFNHKMV